MWKPIEVIKHTLAAATQWVVYQNHFPLIDHDTSRFSRANKSRLQEDVLIDKGFSVVTSFGGSNCAQVYFGLVSRMMNSYVMPSHEKLYVIKSYQDSMRREGVLQCLYRDLAPEQKVDEIIEINYKMRIKDS